MASFCELEGARMRFYFRHEKVVKFAPENRHRCIECFTEEAMSWKDSGLTRTRHVYIASSYANFIHCDSFSFTFNFFVLLCNPFAMHVVMCLHLSNSHNQVSSYFTIHNGTGRKWILNYQFDTKMNQSTIPSVMARWTMVKRCWKIAQRDALICDNNNSFSPTKMLNTFSLHSKSMDKTPIGLNWCVHK